MSFASGATILPNIPTDMNTLTFSRRRFIEAAAARGTELTMEQLLKENRKLEPDLTGLKA